MLPAGAASQTVTFDTRSDKYAAGGHGQKDGLKVFAGVRSDAFARWLTRELGQGVVPMDLTPHFPGLSEAGPESLPTARELADPLGWLARTEPRMLSA